MVIKSFYYETCLSFHRGAVAALLKVVDAK